MLVLSRSIVLPKTMLQMPFLSITKWLILAFSLKKAKIHNPTESQGMFMLLLPPNKGPGRNNKGHLWSLTMIQQQFCEPLKGEKKANHMKMSGSYMSKIVIFTCQKANSAFFFVMECIILALVQCCLETSSLDVIVPVRSLFSMFPQKLMDFFFFDLHCSRTALICGLSMSASATKIPSSSSPSSPASGDVEAACCIDWSRGANNVLEALNYTHSAMARVWEGQAVLYVTCTCFWGPRCLRNAPAETYLLLFLRSELKVAKIQYIYTVFLLHSKNMITL